MSPQNVYKFEITNDISEITEFFWSILDIVVQKCPAGKFTDYFNIDYYCICVFYYY